MEATMSSSLALKHYRKNTDLKLQVEMEVYDDQGSYFEIRTIKLSEDNLRDIKKALGSLL